MSHFNPTTDNPPEDREYRIAWLVLGVLMLALALGIMSSPASQEDGTVVASNNVPASPPTIPRGNPGTEIE
jgi:hypothetical protein